MVHEVAEIYPVTRESLLPPSTTVTCVAAGPSFTQHEHQQARQRSTDSGLALGGYLASTAVANASNNTSFINSLPRPSSYAPASPSANPRTGSCSPSPCASPGTASRGSPTPTMEHPSDGPSPLSLAGLQASEIEEQPPLVTSVVSFLGTSTGKIVVTVLHRGKRGLRGDGVSAFGKNSRRRGSGSALNDCAAEGEADEDSEVVYASQVLLTADVRDLVHDAGMPDIAHDEPAHHNHSADGAMSASMSSPGMAQPCQAYAIKTLVALHPLRLLLIHVGRELLVARLNDRCTAMAVVKNLRPTDLETSVSRVSCMKLRDAYYLAALTSLTTAGLTLNSAVTYFTVTPQTREIDSKPQPDKTYFSGEVYDDMLWVGKDVVAVFAPYKQYIRVVHTRSHETISRIPQPNTVQPPMIRVLTSSYERDGLTDVGPSGSGQQFDFMVLTSHPGVGSAFHQCVRLFRYNPINRSIVQLSQFTTLLLSRPSSIVMQGPFLLSWVPDCGLEVYNVHNNRFVDTLDVAYDDCVCPDSHYSDYDFSGRVFAEQGDVYLTATDRGYVAVQVLPIAQIIPHITTECFGDVDNDLHLEQLTKFIQSVTDSKQRHSTNQIMRMYTEKLTGGFTRSRTQSFTATSSLTAVTSGELERLLNKFRIVSQSTLRATADAKPSSRAKKCEKCSRDFNFMTWAKLCRGCSRHFCSGCAPVRSLRTFGYHLIMSFKECDDVRLCEECTVCCNVALKRLLERRKFRGALKYLRDNEALCAGFDRAEVGDAILHHIVTDDAEYERGARLMRHVLIDNPSGWEPWIVQYAAKQALSVLIPYIPIPGVEFFDEHTQEAIPGENIGVDIYFLALAHLLQTDLSCFYSTLKKWPSGIVYDPRLVAKLVEQRLEKLQKMAMQQLRMNHACFFRASEEIVKSECGSRYYFDTSVDTLMHALLYIYNKMKDYAGTLLRYMEHYVSFTPRMDSTTAATSLAASSPLPTTEAVVRVERRSSVDDTAGNDKDFRSQRLPRVTIEGADCSDADQSSNDDGEDSREAPSLIDVAVYIEQYELWELLQPPEERRPNFSYKGPSILSQLVHRAQGKSVIAALLDKLISSPGETSPAMAGYPLTVDSIVRQLEDTPAIQVYFLHELTQRSPALTVSYHSKMVPLYIDHLPSYLLSFLRTRSSLNLDWKALEEMLRSRKLYRELAYVIGRMGGEEEAIRIIIRCLKSVHDAVEYVVHKGDHTLWPVVFRHVAQNEGMIGDLLDYAEHFDAVQFLRYLPDPMYAAVPEEAARLSRVVAQRRVQAGIGARVLDVFDGDTRHLHVARTRRLRSAVCFKKPKECQFCSKNTAFAADRIFFFSPCGHIYHENCIRSNVAGATLPSKDFSINNCGYDDDNDDNPFVFSHEDVGGDLRCYVCHQL